MLSKDMSDAPDVKKAHTEFSFDSKAEEQVKVSKSHSVFTSAPYLFHSKRSNPPKLALDLLCFFLLQAFHTERLKQPIHLSRA